MHWVHSQRGGIPRRTVSTAVHPKHPQETVVVALPLLSSVSRRLSLIDVVARPLLASVSLPPLEIAALPLHADAALPPLFVSSPLAP